MRCHFKSASAVRKEEIKTAFSALWGGALGWRDSLIVCAMLQKFGLFSACVVYKVFNSIIGVTILGPHRLWIAWISSNIVAKLWHTNHRTVRQYTGTPEDHKISLVLFLFPLLFQCFTLQPDFLFFKCTSHWSSLELDYYCPSRSIWVDILVKSEVACNLCIVIWTVLRWGVLMTCWPRRLWTFIHWLSGKQATL